MLNIIRAWRHPEGADLWRRPCWTLIDRVDNVHGIVPGPWRFDLSVRTEPRHGFLKWNLDVRCGGDDGLSSAPESSGSNSPGQAAARNAAVRPNLGNQC